LGNLTCLLKTKLIKIDTARQIKTSNPIGLEEKMSNQNPPKIATHIPGLELNFGAEVSKILKIITKIKIKFGTNPAILK